MERGNRWGTPVTHKQIEHGQRQDTNLTVDFDGRNPNVTAKRDAQQVW